MTDQEINIAIANACPHVHLRFYGPIWNPEAHGYTTDLNAMHEVEKTLEDSLWHRYTEMLHWVIKEHTDETEGPEDEWFASARIRAEAYLRLKGLWRDQ